MKKTKIYLQKFGRLILLPIFVTGFFFTSCEEEVIQLEPFNQISETVAFTSPEKIHLAVMGMYQAAQIGAFETAPGTFGLRGYPFGAAFVQQGDARGEDVVNIFAFYAFTYQGTYGVTTANNVWYWIDTYRLINRINIVIDGITDAIANDIIEADQGNSYLAEAHLMRAAAYHELMVFFASPYRHTPNADHYGVPYHKTPFTTPAAIEEGLTVGRHTAAQCYEWILEDLDFAEQHLPLKSQRTGNQRVSRATKGAAAAYKVRVHQHMWNMPGVIEHGRKFIDGVYAGHYQLGDEPWDVFYNNYGSGEYIFGMESSNTNYPSVNGALASMYKRRLLVSHSPINWRNPFWLEDDKRRDEEHMVINDNGVMFTDKYKRDQDYDDLSPMMRYAEVILNLAEAYARENQVAEALTYLNMVRDRALADPATQSYSAGDFADNLELLEAILNERRIELAMEGRRWPDINRLQHCPHFPISGVPAKYANSRPAAEHFEFDGPEIPLDIEAIPYTDRRFLWPLPQIELNANPLMRDQQNPGW
ncbi:MAG: RagB/SusD family nutrient uptake outer membrane protein [Bacteroidetes bacterium]|nr:MAG: RagB/SusD family nutrient uptake outer membrane protein [Bacteroidota bacterium]